MEKPIKAMLAVVGDEMKGHPVCIWQKCSEHLAAITLISARLRRARQSETSLGNRRWRSKCCALNIINQALFEVANASRCRDGRRETLV